MPKLASADDLDKVLKIIRLYAEGLSIADVSIDQLGISRRTLQRRLAVLVKQGSVLMTGSGRSTRYFEQSNTFQTNRYIQHLGVQQPSGIYAVETPLSQGALEVQAYVRQARQFRRPCSYQQSFLELYHPNRTFYLAEELRRQLREMGESGESKSQNAVAGTFAKDILNRLLIDLSWASSLLEGNTYSRLDTERLIALGQVAEGKDVFETQMILNHKDAIEYLVSSASSTSISKQTICDLHAFLSSGLMSDPSACGRVRSRPVEISGSVYLPIAVPQRLESLLEVCLEMAQEIEDPFEQAFFLMVHLPYLQPFEDVNKRVSRLAANIPLIRENLCPLSFVDVSQKNYVDAMLGVYELNRIDLLCDVFVSAYERSCQQYVAVKQALVPPDIFRLQYRKELSETVRYIVQNGLALSEPSWRTYCATSLPAGVAEKFFQLVEREFDSLHEGNVIRFGLRPLEYSSWRDQFNSKRN
jgi:Fic family protein